MVQRTCREAALTVRYWDTLLLQAAQVERQALPAPANASFRQSDGFSCGFWALAFLEQEWRLWQGEAPQGLDRDLPSKAHRLNRFIQFVLRAKALKAAKESAQSPLCPRLASHRQTHLPGMASHPLRLTGPLAAMAARQAVWTATRPRCYGGHSTKKKKRSTRPKQRQPSLLRQCSQRARQNPRSEAGRKVRGSRSRSLRRVACLNSLNRETEAVIK